MAFVQDLVGTKAGQVVGTALHSLGAIAMLGGLVAYLVWHRTLRDGTHAPARLQAAAGLLYLAIAANLLGGLMRTYQPGHPDLGDIGESAWVRVMLLKHLFIFTAMGAAIYLVDGLAPRLVRAHKDGSLATVPVTGHQTGVTLVGLGILMAALLGAVAQVTAIEVEPELHADHDGSKVPGEPAQLGQSVEVASAAAHELDLRLEAGATVQWEWDADGTLAFDVHSHEGANVTVHKEATGGAGAGSFTADKPGTYSLLWRNEGATAIHVTYHVEGDYALVSLA